MRHRIKLPPRQSLLLACGAAVAALVYVEGWIWPLKAAAIMIPVSLIVG
jgi:hypothetical protein